MNRLVKSLMIAVCAGVMTSQSSVEQACAQQAVVCTNCGTEWTQLYNKAMMVRQYAQQARQLKTEIGQYQNMLLNSKGVPTQLFGKALQDFQRLTSLMQRSNALSYSAANLDGQFAQRYGTYESYLNQRMGTADWQNKYAQWSREGRDNALYTLKGLGMQAGQLKNDQALQQRLQNMAASAQGRMQAIQVANMLAAQNANQLMQLEKLMLLQLQMQANYIAQQQDRRLTEEMALKQYFKPRFFDVNDGKRY